MQVKVIMRSPISPVDVHAPLADARALMERYALRHLPVTEGAALAGLVSERALRRVHPSTLPELAAWELVPGRDGLRVRDVMSASLLSVRPDTDIKEAASLLAVHRMEALPVVEGQDVVGIVGVRDILGVLGDVERPRRSRLGHIVAAVDDDPRSRTVAAAVELARHHDARLTLVSVLPPLPRHRMPDVGAALWEQVARERTRAARAGLSSRLSDAGDGLAADLVVTEGDLTIEVVALAERRESDLIVVDARAAAPMTVEAPCPVLGVPPTGRARHARG